MEMTAGDGEEVDTWGVMESFINAAGLTLLLMIAGRGIDLTAIKNK